jgi:saccharopine dehydrogenase (NAD+, L-lysine-forming)
LGNDQGDMKIGIVRETKIPFDTRVPLTPPQCSIVQEEFKGIRIYVQPSTHRCFTDESYNNAGITVQENLNECDLLLGVKEVRIETLIPDKTYLFFSHTTKKQEHNRKLLSEIIKNRITLIDYEMLTDLKGIRIIGFGRWAGLLGAYHGIRAMAIKHGYGKLQLPGDFSSLKNMMNAGTAFHLPPVKIAVTGDGRVAGGAEEMMSAFGIQKIRVEDYLQNKVLQEPVYAQLDPEKYNKTKSGDTFELKHFFNNPHLYESDFLRFCDRTDLLIMAAFWDPRAPLLFTADQMRKENFKISVIADITCDLNGSIPSTVRTTTFEDPYYDFNPLNGLTEEPFSKNRNITVMAIDNLPNGLPREASDDFGHSIIKNILPLIIRHDPEKTLDRATITKKGLLTPAYSYLASWVDQSDTQTI